MADSLEANDFGGRRDHEQGNRGRPAVARGPGRAGLFIFCHGPDKVWQRLPGRGAGDRRESPGRPETKLNFRSFVFDRAGNLA